MTIETDVVSRLTSLVSGRIYPLIMPSGATLPAIIYTAISMRPQRSLGGPSLLYNTRMQLDAWAQSLASAKTLRDQIATAMDSSLVEFRVGDIFHNPDLYEPDTGLYRVSSDYSLWHS